MSFFMLWRKCAKTWMIWKSGKLDFATVLEKLRILLFIYFKTDKMNQWFQDFSQNSWIHRTQLHFIKVFFGHPLDICRSKYAPCQISVDVDWAACLTIWSYFFLKWLCKIEAMKYVPSFVKYLFHVIENNLNSSFKWIMTF